MNGNSENQVVARAVKAIGTIYQLSKRAPTLIKQSHLEEKEGLYTFANLPSMLSEPC